MSTELMLAWWNRFMSDRVTADRVIAASWVRNYSYMPVISNDFGKLGGPTPVKWAHKLHSKFYRSLNNYIVPSIII